MNSSTCGAADDGGGASQGDMQHQAGSSHSGMFTWSVFADAGEANCDGGDEHSGVFGEGRGSSQEGVGQRL